MRLHTLFLILCSSLSFLSNAQLDGNTTPTYLELIEIYSQLAADHDEIELYSMGESDYGLPIYVCVLNGAQDSTKTFEKARNSTTLMINNGIHPGEPDGINACLIWIEDWIKAGKNTKDMPVIGIIPSYNAGGMINRSSSSRANQEGPDEYGFRGNAQNLDLNRDFIKMDSKNMFAFAKIFHALDPDAFIDTHVSNGADYQYTLTYIASVKERMAPTMAEITHNEFVPYMTGNLARQDIDMISYVNLAEDVPEKGMSIFNDLPRYSMGYAALFNTMSFTIETHMLKAFNDRTQATLSFLKCTIVWMSENSDDLERARGDAFEYDQNLAKFPFNYQLTEQKDSILFKGFEHTFPISEVTGLKRLKYHRDQPFEKYIPFYQTYAPKNDLEIPDYYVIGRQCTDVIERLKANGVEFENGPFDASKYRDVEFEQYKMKSFKSSTRPYEGHFLHSKMEIDAVDPVKVMIKNGDLLVPTNQRNRRFIVSVLEPEMPDSYFAWNFFDSYVQQKEYFSSYVFEDKAVELLAADPELKKSFEAKKAADKDFRENAYAQLYFIYQHSEFYEPTHNLLPLFRIVR
ncbi:MAG: M14 family zinc carboxypeptidase [Crocinitomicaceae bacterium]|nr:M14 family zinc carboxypeptidase [Crocinitomicaceae bacterium]